MTIVALGAPSSTSVNPEATVQADVTTAKDKKINHMYFVSIFSSFLPQ
jgi:hypothetical protein